MTHTLASLDPASFPTQAPRCPDCGHVTFMHWSHGGPVNSQRPYAPTPCTAVTRSGTCGCTTVHRPPEQETP